MKREPGYYHVNRGNGWDIEYWGGEFWVVPIDTDTVGDKFFEEIDERRIERTEQYGPSPIIVLKRAFDAGMAAATFNGYPGHTDAPKFDEWYKKWKQ